MGSTLVGPEGLDVLGHVQPSPVKSGSILMPYPSTDADPTPTDNVVWDGGDVNDNWMSNKNWINPEIQPNPDDVVHFAGTTRLTPNNDYPVDSEFAGIRFDAGAGAFTLGGNKMIVNGSIINNSANLQTINQNIEFTATRTVSASTGAILIGGVISGAGGLTKSGSDTLILSGTNTFVGETTISEGTLQLGNSGTTGTLSCASIVNNAALIFHTSVDVNYSSTIISGTGLLRKRGATSAITLFGENTYTGITYVEAGTLQIGNTLVDGSINDSAGIDVSAGATLTFSPVSSGGTYSNVISGAGAIAKAGVGTMVLSGVNTNTGTLTIYTGTLQITGSLANSAVVISGGTLLGRSTTGDSATISGTVTVSNSTSSILQPGSFGNNTLNTGALTFSGSSARLTINSTTNTVSKVNVTGTVALGGCGVILADPVNVGGTYKIITASSTMSGTLPTIVTNNTGRYCVLQQTGNDLEVVVGWTPADMTTAAWFDASDASTIVQSGGYVSQWNDKSGTGAHVVQATGADQPQTGTRTINGLNVLDFDGGDRLHRIDATIIANVFPVGAKIFVATVFEIDSAKDNFLVYFNESSTGYVAGTEYNGAGGTKLECQFATNATPIAVLVAEDRDYAATGLTATGGAVTPGVPGVYGGELDRTQSLLYGQAGLDGTYGANTAGAGAALDTAAKFMVLGGQGSSNDTLTRLLDGAIGEIVIAHNVSVADRQKIEGYLAWKWGGL